MEPSALRTPDEAHRASPVPFAASRPRRGRRALLTPYAANFPFPASGHRVRGADCEELPSARIQF